MAMKEFQEENRASVDNLAENAEKDDFVICTLSSSAFSPINSINLDYNANILKWNKLIL